MSVTQRRLQLPGEPVTRQHDAAFGGPGGSGDERDAVRRRLLQPLFLLLARATKAELARMVEYLKAGNRILRGK